MATDGRLRHCSVDAWAGRKTISALAGIKSLQQRAVGGKEVNVAACVATHRRRRVAAGEERSSNKDAHRPV